MSDAALELDGIDAGYGARAVLHGLSISCARGEVLGVLGPNGSGKTTLVRVASGVLRPTAGRVSVGGRDLAGLGAREAARTVAVLAQDTGPLFSISALEAVLLGRHPWHPAFAFETDADLAAAAAALDEVEAGELADRDLVTLSGGERQRVLLARALCQSGGVLLCDEPTAHLDMKHQASVFRLLRSLASRPDGGRAVVIVTHDVNLAAQACDRLALLRPPAAGRPSLVALGPPAEVVTPEHLSEAFGIAASVGQAADGTPFVRRHI